MRFSRLGVASVAARAAAVAVADLAEDAAVEVSKPKEDRRDVEVGRERGRGVSELDRTGGGRWDGVDGREDVAPMLGWCECAFVPGDSGDVYGKDC